MGATIAAGLGSAGELFGGGLSSLFGEAAPAALTGGEAALSAAGPTALGTATDFLGAGGFDALSGSALAGTGADVLGTAGSFLAAPGAALGAGGAGIGGVAADAALSNAASTGLASGTGDILAASAPTAAFDAAIPAAGVTGITGAGTGTSGSVFPNVSTPGVATSTPNATSAVQGLTSGGTGSVAGPSSVSAPAGAGGGAAGATDLTSAAGTAGTASTAAKTTPSFLDNLVAGAEKNAIPAAIAGGGLAYNLAKGSGSAATSTPSGGALNTQASSLAATSPQLMGYLTSGTLPAGMQAGLTKATQDAKTAAISKAAASGQPTDPAMNSTLSAELAQIDQQETITSAQLGQQLLQSGLSEAQLSSSDYTQLLQADETQQKNISDSIANFAKALGGLGGGVNLKIA